VRTASDTEAATTCTMRSVTGSNLFVGFGCGGPLLSSSVISTNCACVSGGFCGGGIVAVVVCEACGCVGGCCPEVAVVVTVLVGGGWVGV